VLLARQTRLVAPCGPVQAGQDVGVEAPALAQHPHRQDAHAEGRAGHADAVVRRRTDDARDLGAVPAAVGRTTSEEGTPGVGVLGGGDPVAGVARVGVAAVAVVGGVAVVDQVLPGQHAAGQVGVVGQHAGVEHGDHQRRTARHAVPGALRVGGRQQQGIGRTQVPLTDVGPAPLAGPALNSGSFGTATVCRRRSGTA
jgi:hypothetical protein